MNQEEILLHILKENENTDLGKRYHFKNIRNISAYQRSVPLTSYDDYAPLIELMTRLGEYSIFTAQNFSCYITRLGSMGTSKILPCTKEYGDLCYEGMSDVFSSRARSLVLFESLPKTRVTRDKKYINTVYGTMLEKWHEWRQSSISGHLLHLGELAVPDELLFPQEIGAYAYEWVLFAVSDRDVRQILAPTTWNVLHFITRMRKNWDSILSDIENGSISDQDLPEDMRSALMKKWKKNPARAAELKSLGKNALLKEIWPGLKRIVADGAAGLSIYTEQVRKNAGNVELDYGFGLNTEALYARHIVGSENYQLLTDLNFYEFRPLADDSKERLLLIDELEAGKAYELYVTTRYGFYRYRMGEIISVTEVSAGSVKFTRAYRTDETMPCFGAEFTQQQIAEAILDFEEKFCFKIEDYAYVDRDDHITVMLEPANPEQPVTDEMKEHLDSCLQKINPEYQQARTAGKCRETEILCLQPQTQMLFYNLCQYKYKLPNDMYKPIHYLNTPKKDQFFSHLTVKC